MSDETKTLNIRPQAHEDFMKLCVKNKRKAIDQFEIILEAFQ